MEIKHTVMQRNKQRLNALRLDRRPWWEHWRELSDFFLPRRYVWLLSDNERGRVKSKNPFILDGTGTQAARTLASGMMNGITSPTRPWFRLRLAGYEDETDSEVRVWLDEVQRRMMTAMAETNFYNSLAVLYLDLVVFGTGSMLIYEDFEKVFHCQNNALGEFYLAMDPQHRVNVFAREFRYTVAQCVEEFGLENCSVRVRNAYEAGGARLQETVDIVHLIEPNDDREGSLPQRFAYREFYWEKAVEENIALRIAGYRDKPGIWPRWEIIANDAYGSSPAMDALPDVIQLQHETKAKAKGLDRMNEPPMLADVQLEHRPISLVPRGITFVHGGQNNIGLRPAYTVQPPVQELSFDIREIQGRIREQFHNDLFTMISQLDTVRSATEIDARREEKLVLLGPVLERFENEALDPAIQRIFAIMDRASLFPPPPPGIEGMDIEIQYVSILSVAQRAVGVVPTERLLGMVGQILAVRPEVADIINWDDTIRNYGNSLGVEARTFNSPDAVAMQRQAREEQLAAQQAAVVGPELVDSAKTLSETDVGGGANALQRMLQGNV